MKAKSLLLVALVGAYAPLGCSKESTEDRKGSAAIAALTTADVTKVEVTVSGPNIATDMVQSLTFGGGQWSGVINGIPIGANTFLAEAFDAADTLIYSGTAQGTVVEGQPLGVTIYLQQETPPDPFSNGVPYFESLVISPSDPAPDEDVTLTVTVSDPDVGDTVVLAWTATDGALNPTNAATVVWTAPSEEGPETLTITATDDSSAQAVLSLSVPVAYPTGDATTVNIDLNTWPVVTNLVPSPTRIDVGGVATTSLDLTASDNDATDTLSYSWGANCTGDFSDATAEDPMFTLTADNSGAPCTLTVTVTDGRGGTTTASVTIQTGPEIIAQALDCSDLTCTFTAANSTFTNYYIPSVINPADETIPFSGAFDIDCEPNGNECGCKADLTSTVGPFPIPGIGDVCLVPMPAGTCPTGTISCDPGLDKNLGLTQRHTIGTCTDNPDCRAQCDVHCAAEGAVRVPESPACEGFCRASDIPMCWSDETETPLPGYSICPVGDTCDELAEDSGHDGYCGCQCTDIGDDTPSGAGEALLHVGWAVHVLFDNNADGVADDGLGLDGLPCTADDIDDPTLATLPDMCFPFTTSSASVYQQDAGYLDSGLWPFVPIDGVINPLDRSGTPFTCEDGAPSTASGALLQGVAAYKDTRRYDFATMLTVECE